MKKIQKSLCVVSLFLAVSFSALAGGRSDGSAPQVSGGNAPTGYAVPVNQGGEWTDLFTVFKGTISMSPDVTTQQQALREKTGINYTVRGIQSNNLQTSINLMLASGEELADVLAISRNQAIRDALIESGKVMELSFLYNSTSLKTIPSIPEKIKQYITETDGKRWVIPGTYDLNPDDPYSGWSLDAFWIRTDLMRQAGVSTQDISTLAGFEGALRKFRALRDPAGRALIPLSFTQSGQATYPHQENIILAMFGVDMAGGVSGMPPVMEIGGRRVFAFDNPDYLEAYKWMSRMYNEGLIDIEVTTQNAERFQEKLESGMIASYAGHQAQGLWDYWKEMKGPEDNPAKWYMEPFQSPRVPNKTKQATRYVNPYPGSDIFIKKDTKRLNAAVHWIEWAQEPVYYRMHEVENGPLGTTWRFTDNEQMFWQFEPEFERDRSSGDAVRAARVYNPVPVYTRNKKWYPWFYQAASNLAPGNFLMPKYNSTIANEIVNHRVLRDMDLIQAPADGIIVSNLPTLNQVRDEYTAKMIMAKTQTECETVYREFLQMLERRANWSGMKAEWERLYASIK